MRENRYGGSLPDQLYRAIINLEQSYPASAETVFAEFADPAIRAKWSAPLNDTLIYDKTDFREGGNEVFRCGPPNDLRFQGETTYQVILPNQCVVFTEILREGDKLLAVALNTLDFGPTADGTKLKVTVQLVSFVGAGVVPGYESGNRGALDGLARHLAA